MTMPRRRRRRRGSVLLSALVMLVALMLGAAALMRMVESANLLSGNLAFKRGATLAAKSDAEAAISWLAQQDAGALAQDQASHGYYASDAGDFDAGGNRSGSRLSQADWQGDNCGGAVLARCLRTAALHGPDAAGHTGRYLIQRLCAASGPSAAPGDCAFHVPPEAESSTRTGLSYSQGKRFGGAPLGYYRITARASGPRNTVGLVEVLVRF